MNPTLLLRGILQRMTRFKLKTLFMGLGIATAVLAMVLLYSVLNSVEKLFLSFIDRSYPADAVVVMAGSGFMGNVVGRASLKLSEMEAVANQLGSPAWDPLLTMGARDIKRDSNLVSVSVVGVSHNAESVRRRSAAEGEFFSEDDLERRANVVLLGSTTAKNLFPGESAVGQQIFFDNLPFEIKGVLETIGSDPHGTDQDDTVWLPITTLMDRVLKIDFVAGSTFLLDDPNRAESAKQEITEYLRKEHQIGAGQEDDFTVIVPTTVRGMHAKSYATWQLFVRLIVGTAFLISALVILSIMQVSIKGRTPEIGLRKALGARSSDIQVQIVLEVLLVAIAAAVVGLVAANLCAEAIVPKLATKFGVREVVVEAPSWGVVAVAIAAALATGVLGGLWPARKASRLDPVRALKQ
jgi:putative ABC transport system permease protein